MPPTPSYSPYVAPLFMHIYQSTGIDGSESETSTGRPCVLGDPQTKKQKSNPNKRDKIRIGGLTLAFLGAQKRGEMLHHPCILGDPQTKGDKIRIGCLTPTLLGAQKWAEMLHHPCILG